MKEMAYQMASYNYWANRLLSETILGLEEPLHQQLVKSSFPNLYTTVLHMWDAESGWWQRLHSHEQIVIPSQQFHPTVKEVVKGLLHQSAEWEHYASAVSNEELSRVVECTTRNGSSYHAAAGQILHHVCNHSTYHRGQLITMMRELGETGLPQTDFIYWIRTKENQDL